MLQSDAEGNISRNDLNKLKESMNSKTQFSDSMKQNYASQLVKTNEIRTSYYYEKLPTVINKLQDLEKNRIELIRTGILDCISKEREVSATMNTIRGDSQTTLTTFCPFFTTYLHTPSVNISRGFLLHMSIMDRQLLHQMFDK